MARKRTQPNQVTPSYLGVPEIAQRLGISRTHAWRLMARGDFGPLIDISSPDSTKGRWKASAEKVDAWQAERSFDPTG